MKQLITLWIISAIVLLPISSATMAQDAAPLFNPSSAEVDESVTSTPENDVESRRMNDLLYNMSLLEGEGDKLQSTFGIVDASGKYTPGALGKLKVKPSDKQRLIKIANGSLTDKEKE